MTHIAASKANALLALLFLITGTAFSQSMTSFLNHVNSLGSATDKQDAVDSLMAVLTDFPWVDGDTAHFLLQDDVTSSMQVAGDFNGWSPSSGTKLSGTDLWYFSRQFELDARMDYKMVLDAGWILDPLNPNTVLGGFGPNSELAMPEYEQPWEIEDLGNPAGTITVEMIPSSFTGKTYSVQIYLPPGYDDLRAYPAAYFHDGHEYVGLASTDLVFDNLIADGLVEPLIGVFVRPTDRNAEYAFEDRFDYADFFALELVPWIDSAFATDAQKHRRAIIGASFGGNISGLISHRHPGIFGNVGLHSAAFWPNSNEVYNDWVGDSPPNDIRVASIWGSYEGSLSANNHAMVNNVLVPDSFDHIWEEKPEGHSWGLWRATVDDMVSFFFPPGGVGFDLPSILAAEVSPNPASAFVQVQAELQNCQEGVLAVHDLSGRLLFSQSTLTGGECGAARLMLPDLSQGVYLIRLQVDAKTFSAPLTIARP